MPPVRKVNDQFASSGLERHKVFMLDRDAPSVPQMNPKRAKGLRAHDFPDALDLHT